MELGVELRSQGPRGRPLNRLLNVVARVKLNPTLRNFLLHFFNSSLCQEVRTVVCAYVRMVVKRRERRVPL